MDGLRNTYEEKNLNEFECKSANAAPIISRFEIPAARHMGMVVFRLKGDNAMTEKLLKKLNSR